LFDSVALSTLFPDKLILGLEIRSKVVEYVQERIQKLRIKNPGQYQNISVVHTNAMKYLPHYFKKGQVHFQVPKNINFCHDIISDDFVHFFSSFQNFSFFFRIHISKEKIQSEELSSTFSRGYFFSCSFQ
jgi:hypothetical protein